MQWDLLRSFEAVARLGSLTAASRALGVSQSTISRQLARLEEDARSPLLLRESPVRLTERGEALLAAVAPMLDAARAAEVALESSPELHGQVTVTTVGELLRWGQRRKGLLGLLTCRTSTAIPGRMASTTSALESAVLLAGAGLGFLDRSGGLLSSRSRSGGCSLGQLGFDRQLDLFADCNAASF